MSDTLTVPTTRKKTKAKPTLSPMYNVVLLNDDDHTFGYVIEMLGSIFGHSPATGFRMACEVHTNGRVIVLTTHKELAELRQEQIHSHGPDRLVPACKGSMSALVEPAG